MQRGLGRRNGKPIVLLGLEPVNMARLREGQPIQVNLKNLIPDGPPIEELPDIDVIIYFAGKDETELLMKTMKKE